MPQHKLIRKHLIRLIKEEKYSTKFTLKRPNDWNPYKVRNPQEDNFQVFTEVSAWDFIVELLETGHPMEEIKLRKPLGAKGYVIKVKLEANQPKLYIKLELGKIVFGRSFHYSKRS